MKWLWWVGGIVAFLVMIYSCALPGDLAVGRDDGDTLAGTYTVNGVDPTGVEYSGTVVITPAEGRDRYTIEWIITGAIHTGTAVVRGDEVTAEWRTIASGGGTGAGTARYTVEADGSLVGTRLVDGVDEPAVEEILPEA